MLKFYHRKNLRVLWIFVFICAVLSVVLMYLGLTLRPVARRDVQFGVTFSQKYAAELGLDWRAALGAILNELKVRRLRIPVYWDQVEPAANIFIFSDIDWQLQAAETAGTDVVLAIGRRLPRWPECHIPNWARAWDEARQQAAVLRMLAQVVNRYKDYPAVTAWQVENEPFLDTFGICPPSDEDFFGREIDLVRSLDPSRPIMVTESGELSTWVRAAKYADVVGVSMYRTTWNDVLGYFYYPLPPLFYTRKAAMIAQSGTGVVVSELQAEPWAPRPLVESPLDEQFVSMNRDIFRKNVDFARRTHLGSVYLWGAEWWYWLREKKGIDDLWNEAMNVF